GLKYSFEALEPTEVLILYAPAGLERFIAEAGVADADGYQRSIDEAGAVLAAAPAYGVNYSALDKSQRVTSVSRAESSQPATTSSPVAGNISTETRVQAFSTGPLTQSTSAPRPVHVASAARRLRLF